VNSNCLKLTTYFGERDRTADGLLSEKLLDLYEGHETRAGILLRGSEGFGRLHHLRTDRMLSMSEDLPVVSVAVDTSERIESLLEQVVAIKRRGLITLERGRLLYDEIGAEELGDRPGEATKLTIYIGRGARVNGRPAFSAVCELLYREGIAGASVLLGVDGVKEGRRARARFFGRNADVPLMIVAVGSGDRIARVLPELGRLLDSPLMTLERARICKRDGQRLLAPHALPGTDVHGRQLWQKLTVYSSQSSTYDQRPLHLEIVRRLRASGAAGATCLSGVFGFHGDERPSGDRLMQVRRHVPVVTIAIDTPEQTARSFQIIDELTGEHGLVTSETVPAMRALSETDQLGDLGLADPGF
jgi:PII-like signaling protein